MEFSADDYAVLIAHLAPFRKFPEPFLCLIRMSHSYTLDEDTYPTFLHDDRTDGLAFFFQVADPTKVKVGEREHAEEESRLLDSTIGRVVPLLPVSPACAESELGVSVGRLFDEGGSADQGDSTSSGGQEAETEIAMGVRIVADENVVAGRPKHPRKKRQAVTDASVGVVAVATLPMVTSSVSATPEHESGVPANSITGLNLRTIGASERFVISSDSSHHSSTNASGAKGNSIISYVVIPPVMTEAVVTSHAVNIPTVSEMGIKVTPPVHASMFHDSDSTEIVKANTAGPSYSAKQDLSMCSRELNSETLHQVFVPQCNVLNDSLLDDYDVSREFVDHLAPPALFSQIREMDYHHLFTEFNVGTARQACLNAEVRMRTEYFLSERKRLESECEKQVGLLKAKDDEVENLKAQLLLKEAEAAEVAHLHAQVSTAKATERMRAAKIDALKQRNVALENEKDSIDGKVMDFQSSVVAKGLEVKDLNVAVSSLRSQKDGLVDQVSGYEWLKEQIKEFQDVQMNIVNDKVAIDPWPEACRCQMLKLLGVSEYLSALGAAISRAIEKGMQDGLSAGIDHGSLVDAPGMSNLRPHVDQLMLPVHRSEDQVVLGETSLSFTLSVTHSHVERIRENVAAKRSALISVWTPLVDPAPLKASVPPITIEDYEIIGMDGPEDAQGNSQGNVAPFPTVEFEKEELDTTPERDLAS
ncbi:hypothetical protein Tco_0528519 [Tanacetum coccineum]